MLIFSVKVEGESCWPHLVPGRNYFATNLLKPKIGDFIVFQNPKDQIEIFVKRVKEIKNNSYFVEGTVSWAESSKNFGEVNRNLVLGKILR
ncbi:hypothetical protein IH779_01350 [Patescibacteria group bacterium]|nr:hypothetical protein [Patescibacteria group bacterium]